MQSIFGALLTAGYAAAFTKAINGSSESSQINAATRSALTKSYSSAADLAQQYPQHASQIIAAARTSFLQGDHWAYFAGLVAVVVGAVLVFFFFPKFDREKSLVQGYHEADTRADAGARGT